MDTSHERCEECGGRKDRPGLFRCVAGHPEPRLAERIAMEIEWDLRGRSGMDWDDIDGDTQDEIRETWAALVRKVFLS